MKYPRVVLELIDIRYALTSATMAQTEKIGFDAMGAQYWKLSLYYCRNDLTNGEMVKLLNHLATNVGKGKLLGGL